MAAINISQGIQEAGDIFDAFIDPKYIIEPQTPDSSNADLFRLYFGNELSSQLPPTSQNVPTLSNFKAESTDIDMLLGNLLESSASLEFGVTDSALIHGASNGMETTQPPAISPQPTISASVINRQPTDNSFTSTAASMSLSIATSLPKPMQRHSSAEAETKLDPNNPNFQNLSSKERRQLRNKISARNFRVRRKEYISTLEQQVQYHQNELKSLRDSMSKAEDENKRLRRELLEIRKKADAHVPTNEADSPTTMDIEIKEERNPNSSAYKLKSGMNSFANSEPYSKDVPNSAGPCASPRWQDSRVIVR